MKIGTCRARAGFLIKGKLKVANYKRKNLYIPLWIAKGKHEGRTVFISAGMHGNEINSIETLTEVVNSLDIKRLKGTIIFLPVLNPWGFEKRERYIPFDNKDLNRCFHLKGRTVSIQIAKTILNEVIAKCDFGIDLHDSGSKNILLPHPRIFKGDKCKMLKEMSYVLGTDIILEREGDPGMMAIESFKKFKTPVLTFEIGGAFVLNEVFIEQGVKGIKNILTYYEMTPGVLDLPMQQFFLEERKGYEAPISGILHLHVHLGQAVKKGETIAKIHSPLKDKEEVIKSSNYGIVFSIRQSSIVDKGESILSMLHFKMSGRKELIPIQAKMLMNKQKFKRVITHPTILIDDLFSLLGFSYKIVGKTIKTPLKKLEEYFK